MKTNSLFTSDPTISFFWYLLDESGAAEFVTASQVLIDSPIIPAEVKPIFQDFLSAIVQLKPCVDQPNAQCILDAFKNTGLKGMEQCVSLTHGELQRVFQGLCDLDIIAIAKISRANGDGQQAVEIANSIFSTKAKMLQKYFQEHKA